ncbi:hypothetical protein RHMOL_Rhmol05G0088000 [Rhododendron molle]|uniref:Uncharacterized protein n=1 Tax=Rhododendron molle TaxID=49168 RepID=A0ACC0NLZ3_RHOML|nr:hypothetical protein RHMOL_Rhmol05G0088000 [Rhododendron molle]
MMSPQKQSFNIHSIFGEDIIETANRSETLLAPPPNTPNKKSKREATTQAPQTPAQQWIHHWTAAQQKTLQMKKLSTAPTT